MKKGLIRWGLNILAIILTAYLMDSFSVSGWGAIFGSIVLAVVNTVIRPIIVLLTLPINIATLGLFTLVINGFTFWLTSKVVDGFYVEGLWAAVLAALVVSIFSTVIGWFVND